MSFNDVPWTKCFIYLNLFLDFSKKGNQDLQFDGFNNFMKNLQTEVLELEFHEFSKGHERISEVDFAKILLRYTYLDTEEYVN